MGRSLKALDLERLQDVDSDEGPDWKRDLWSRDLSGSTAEPLSSNPAWSRNITAGDTVLATNEILEAEPLVRIGSSYTLTHWGARCRASSLPSSIRINVRNRERARNRMLARAGLGLSEHLAERVVERSLEHVLERGAEHAAEVVIKRQGQKSMGHIAETLTRGFQRNTEKLERSAGSTVQRFLEGSGERGLNTSIAAQAERRHVLTILSLRVLVTFIGMLLVLHMVHSDLHRAKAERASWRPSRTAWRMFMLATLMDGIDLLVHIMVLADLTVLSIDHQVLHGAESVGFWCAVIGTFALILGELVSAPSQRAVQAHVMVPTGKQD
eukprot:TRINITY_DN105656_c0_g1_i1.p1 TRINITY_DN105656_c0_g1~~TRINITY_DN105656_c0_g1_i1.p1  ORF type:complete len:326 (+),score=45.19 TRINITY_DN105656_c0_g1_i1:59-1036(+)